MDADECLIQSDGSVRGYYWDGDYFKDSYGNSPALDYADYYAYFVSSGGGVDNYSNADWDSCGNIYSKKIFSFRSPYRTDGYNAYGVYPDGLVVISDLGVKDSYGKH